MAIQDMGAVTMTDEEMDLQDSTLQIEQEEDAMFAEMAPKGKFSARGMRILTKAMNKVLPMFELPVMEGDVGDVAAFPADLTRALSMISQAASDAAAQDMLSAELTFSLDDITSDGDVKVLSGKLESLSKDKDFKKFLKVPAPEAEEASLVEEPGAEATEPTDAEMEALFTQRL